MPAGAVQGMHVLALDAPVAALHVPAGQGVGDTEPSGQYAPGGQGRGAPEEQ